MSVYQKYVTADQSYRFLTAKPFTLLPWHKWFWLWQKMWRLRWVAQARYNNLFNPWNANADEPFPLENPPQEEFARRRMAKRSIDIAAFQPEEKYFTDEASAIGYANRLEGCGIVFSVEGCCVRTVRIFKEEEEKQKERCL